MRLGSKLERLDRKSSSEGKRWWIPADVECGNFGTSAGEEFDEKGGC